MNVINLVGCTSWNTAQGYRWLRSLLAAKAKSPKAFVKGKRLPICPVFIGHCSFVVFYQMPHKRPTKKNGLEFFSKPLILWWVWKDLNLRPRDYESPALTS